MMHAEHLGQFFLIQVIDHSVVAYDQFTDGRMTNFGDNSPDTRMGLQSLCTFEEALHLFGGMELESRAI
jgi:hypothetical protein